MSNLFWITKLNAAVQYFATGVKSVWLVVPTLQLIVVYSSPEEPAQFSSGVLADNILNINTSVDKVFEVDE